MRGEFVKLIENKLLKESLSGFLQDMLTMKPEGIAQTLMEWFESNIKTERFSTYLQNGIQNSTNSAFEDETLYKILYSLKEKLKDRVPASSYETAVTIYKKISIDITKKLIETLNIQDDREKQNLLKIVSMIIIVNDFISAKHLAIKLEKELKKSKKGLTKEEITKEFEKLWFSQLLVTALPNSQLAKDLDDTIIEQYQNKLISSLKNIST